MKTPTRQNKIISPFLIVSNNIPPSIFYENDSSDVSDSDVAWCETTWGRGEIR